MVRRREILGVLSALVLLWCITIARLVNDFCTSNFSEVFLYQGCIGGSASTVMIGCMMELVGGCWFLQKFFLPLVFSDRWDTFDILKRQKLVGFVAQIVVRLGVAIQLGTILFGGPRNFSLEGGLFGNRNAKDAYRNLLEHGVATTCTALEPHDVAAFRAWYFSKYHTVAVHVWELSFIPGLPLDAWLHHLFVIAVAAVGSSPDSLLIRPEMQPYLDFIGLSFIFGASLNFAVKFCVVMYHYTAPDSLRQARWMEASITGAMAILVVFYLGLPVVGAIAHARDFGFFVFTFVIMIPVVFLAWVEIRLIIVKRSIARSARRKAAEREQQTQELGTGLGESPAAGTEFEGRSPTASPLRTPSSNWGRPQVSSSWISAGPLAVEDGLDALPDAVKEASC